MGGDWNGNRKGDWNVPLQLPPQPRKKERSATNKKGKPTQEPANALTSADKPTAQRPALRDATTAVNNADSIDDLRGK